MADYQFDTPWANDSQNVQTFTEEEWKKGIGFKSLAESKTLNGVMKEVTRRFLELEEVEDRQYRYDYVVDDDVSWQNFVNGAAGNPGSILVRKGIYTADKPISVNSDITRFLRLEEGVTIQADSITSSGVTGLSIIGGILRGKTDAITISGCILTRTRVVGNATLTDSLVSQSLINSNTVTGGRIEFCKFVNNKSITGAVITSSLLAGVVLTDCTLSRSKIQKNTKLTNCTLIDCDYAINTYANNLVTGTTFRNCNLDVQAPNAVLNGNLFANGISNTPCSFINCKLYFLLPNGNCVKGIARDCEFIATTAGEQSVALMIEGNSSMQISSLLNDNQFEAKMRDINKYGIIRTDNPFFRLGNEARPWILNSSTVIYPGALNVIRGNANLTTFQDNPSYRVKYFFRNRPGNGVDAGSIIGTSSTFRFIVPVSSAQNRIYYPEFSVIL